MIATSNVFRWLGGLADVEANWDFFREGLASLNDPHGARGDLTELQFFQILLYAIAKHPRQGGVGLLTSKNGKPLGYGIMLEDTEPFCKRSAVVYAVYSNGKCATTTEELLENAERWARTEGFVELHACSRRINGAAIRLFEKKWKFKRICLVFRKEVI